MYWKTFHPTMINKWRALLVLECTTSPSEQAGWKQICSQINRQGKIYRKAESSYICHAFATGITWQASKWNVVAKWMKHIHRKVIDKNFKYNYLYAIFKPSNLTSTDKLRCRNFLAKVLYGQRSKLFPFQKKWIL